MDAQNTPYVPLSSDNAALVLVDHQLGLLTGVRDIPVAELKNNVVSLAKAMRILNLPIVVTTTGRDSMWGPTFPELVQALPEVDIIDRASVNAWDDPKVSKAIEATGRRKLIFAGVSLEVCAAFPAAVESKDVRAEVPSRKSKRFDTLERAHLPVWFAAVRGLNNPVVSAYLQALLLTGIRREEMAALRWQDVDFQWGSMWVKDKVAEEGRKIPLTPYLAGLLLNLKRINETPPRVKRITGDDAPNQWHPSEWVFFSKAAANGRIAEPRIPHNRALSVAGLKHVTLHGLRRTFANLAEWVEMPRGVVAQIMGHAPNATAEKHYINRPLELLSVWHGKYEAWILEQAGIPFAQEPEAQRLRMVNAA